MFNKALEQFIEAFSCVPPFDSMPERQQHDACVKMILDNPILCRELLRIAINENYNWKVQ